MPKPVTWTPELVSRFWDGLARTPILDKMSFARLAGPVLVEFLTPWLSKQGQCLDYGGGSGHLIRALVAGGFPSASYEPSGQRAAVLADLLKGEPLFLGAVERFDQRQFDTLVCTEVIEHIPVPDVDGFVQGLLGRVKPGGRFLLTTPHAEDLESNGVYCPVCDSTFHRWQHQRNFTVSDMRQLLDRHDLEIEWLGLVGFDDIVAVRDFCLRRRLGEPWPWCRDEPDGSRTPVLGAGDHIVVVCRVSNHEEMTLSSPDRLLTAGFKHALRAGGEPIVVTPTADLGFGARTIIVSEDVFEIAQRDVEIDSIPAVEGISDPEIGRAMLVFPGHLDALEAAIASGRLPNAPVAWVYEQKRWRMVRRTSVPKVAVVESEQSAPRRYIRHQIKRLAMRMRTAHWARRLQPRLDEREDAVLAALHAPGDFPYRMNHVVSRRVLFAIGTLGSGGAERQLINTAEGLSARGFDDVHILVNHLHNDPSNSFYLEKAATVAASVRASPVRDHGVTEWGLSQPGFRRIFGEDIISLILNDAEVIRDLSPEVVHCSLDWTNVTVGLAAVLAGVPHVFVSGRNLSPVHFAFFQWFMYPAYRALARCTRVQILNNSIAGRDDYADWLRVNRASVSVLRNGLHTGEFQLTESAQRAEARNVLDLPSDANVVMGAFRLSAEKRPLLWIDAAAQILKRAPNTHFVLCGVGQMSADVEDRARSRGLGDRLKLLGARTDIQTVFAAADVVLQTSLQEGTPNVLIEAQASGLPVVTTAAFGAEEAVDDGVTGRVVRKETPTAIAVAVVEILANEDFRKRAREFGPRFVELRFGFDRMINETLTAYAESGVDWAQALLPFDNRRYIRIQPDWIRRDMSFGWAVHLPEFVEYSDSLDDPQRSGLVLMEDGRPLGPSHSEHAQIREQGGGGYSHWGDALYFSTPDGSDPRSNGAAYLALISVEPGSTTTP